VLRDIRKARVVEIRPAYTEEGDDGFMKHSPGHVKIQDEFGEVHQLQNDKMNRVREDKIFVGDEGRLTLLSGTRSLLWFFKKIPA
jgi:hypothetical protein